MKIYTELSLHRSFICSILISWPDVALTQPSPAQDVTQTRDRQCVVANDEVTRRRIGRDRAGNTYSVNVGQAVSVGRMAAARCQGDDQFLLAYALARLDLAKEVKRLDVSERTALFNGGIEDLELIKLRVLSRQSDSVEIFNILGLIYYETKQYEKSISTLEASAPFISRLTQRSLRNTFFTRGMAQFQLGQFPQAATSFSYAKKFGHPDAARWELLMRSKK